MGFSPSPWLPSRPSSGEWRWAEELGFDHAWLPDTWSIKGFADFEAGTLLAALRAQHPVELGIGEFVFYWPPLANLAERRSISADQRATVERTASARLAAHS